MVRPEPRRSDESLPISNAAFAGLVAALIVVGAVVGFAAFALFGNAEEAPDVEFEAEQYGASDQQVAIEVVSGDVEDPETVAVAVDGERVHNNSGDDWRDSEGGLEAGSAAFVGYNFSQNGPVVVDERDHPALDQGLPPETEVDVVWFSSESDSTARLFSHEVERRDE